jgi:hypothetical protein
LRQRLLLQAYLGCYVSAVKKRIRKFGTPVAVGYYWIDNAHGWQN